MKILANQFKNEETIKLIMDNLIPINKYLDQINEGCFEYENLCEKVQEQFSEILEALDLHLMKYTNKNLCITDLMLFKMWDYLREVVSFDEMMKYLRSEYATRDK